jgi:hypothetical protein
MTKTVLGALLVLACCSTSCGDGNGVTAPSTEASSPITFTWTSLLSPGGSASRLFTASQSGSVSVTLQGAETPLGIGIGVPRAGGSGCRASVSAAATPAPEPQLTTLVESGDYCVIVFDAGEPRAEQIAFMLQVVHP